MLIELKIKNFAIIKDMSIKFTSGLNIISGDTGSGKSMIMKCLNILIGAKSESKYIRTNTKQASICGLFDIQNRPDIQKLLDQQGFSLESDLLIIRRVLSLNGKSRIYINDQITTLINLKKIISPLMEVNHPTPLIESTGQHDSILLQSSKYHLDLLDSFSKINELRKNLNQAYQDLKLKKLHKRELLEKKELLYSKVDFLQFQKKEIETLNLKANEEEEISVFLKKSRLSSNIKDHLEQSYEYLSERSPSVLNGLHKVQELVLQLAEKDPTYNDLQKQLQFAMNELEDIAYTIGSQLNSIQVNPKELDQKEARLSQIKKYKKKYGSSFEEITRSLKIITEEINIIDNIDQNIKNITIDIENQEKLYLFLAEEAHAIRIKQSCLLTKKLNAELKDLNMKGTKFNVVIKKSTQQHESGMSSVEFYTSTGAKNLLPLTKFASGGELSRILLSLKKVIGSHHSKRPQTFLFDEIDTGVSGETAEKVGHKLKEIALKQQIICVTHLPQVAQFSTSHFYIEKSNNHGNVTAKVSSLNKKEKVIEIARLISGSNITKSSLVHAKQLMQNIG